MNVLTIKEKKEREGGRREEGRNTTPAPRLLGPQSSIYTVSEETGICLYSLAAHYRERPSPDSFWDVENCLSETVMNKGDYNIPIKSFYENILKIGLLSFFCTDEGIVSIDSSFVRTF